MNSYLNRSSITALAVIMVGFLICPMMLMASNLISVSQVVFAPVSQESSASFQSAPPSSVNLEQTRRAPHFEVSKMYTGEKISLDFQNADLHNIIRIIGEVSGKNIVVSDAVTGKVTLKLQNVPWDQALDIVLNSRGLGVEESGNVLTIQDLQTLQAQRTARDLARAQADAAISLAPLSKKIFTPKYAPIGTVAAELDKIKSIRGKIVTIGNDIYVEDEFGSINTMSQVFVRIDRVARQILIEARIIEASSNFINSVGVSWGAKYDEKQGWDQTKASGNLDVGGNGATLGLGFINKAGSLKLNATFSASESSNETRTLSAPRIMAANGEKVSIKQGQQVPYKSGSSSTTAANVMFKEVVMELEVTPLIEENGRIISLEIKLTNDTLGGSTGAGEEPPINTKEAETKLMVKDGETVVIGGIIVDSVQEGYSRVPGVHRIPLLGWLFKSRSIDNSKSELLIFITANIIPINI